jgi:hypothetical protein
LVIAVVFLVVDNYVLESEPEEAEIAADSIPAAQRPWMFTENVWTHRTRNGLSSHQAA